MSLSGWLKSLNFLEFPEGGGSPEIYRLLRRRIIALMIVITIIPLISMAMINSHLYQKSLREEIVNPSCSSW